MEIYKSIKDGSGEMENPAATSYRGKNNDK